MTSKLMSYEVVREHEGDRPYAVGETRRALSAEVGHLVPHVLQPLDEQDDEEAETEVKVEPAPQNKAEGAAPANKASGRKATTKG